MKTKIAIIVQRYGNQINGGAEVHARMIAEKLNKKYEVTILTSRAIDYHTWDPVLPEGESFENDIKIIRFDHTRKENRKKAHKINRKSRGRLWYQKLYRFLNKPKWYKSLFPAVEFIDEKGLKFLTAQGPALLTLPSYLDEHRNDYSAFIFFTYLYYPTAVGMPVVADKSIFIPTLHDEPPAYIPCFKELFPLPEWIFFNTRAEQLFAEKMFDLSQSKKEIVAVGIESTNEETNPDILSKFKINSPYLIYVGRIDEAKGCESLLDYFIKFNSENAQQYNLVLVGKNMMKEVKHPNIIYTGFVSDEEKTQLMKQAKLLIVPSKYESLSLVLLESFNYKVPVLVNKNCTVLKDHIDESKGGAVYSNYSEFREEILRLTKQDELIAELGKNGYAYVQRKFVWDGVLEKFDTAINQIISKEKN